MISEIDINQIDLKYKDSCKIFDGKNIYNKDRLKELGLKHFKVGARG